MNLGRIVVRCSYQIGAIAGRICILVPPFLCPLKVMDIFKESFIDTAINKYISFVR